MFHVLGVKSRDICQIFTSCPVDLEHETHHVVQSRIILVCRTMWWARSGGRVGESCMRTVFLSFQNTVLIILRPEIMGKPWRVLLQYCRGK